MYIVTNMHELHYDLKGGWFLQEHVIQNLIPIRSARLALQNLAVVSNTKMTSK